MHKPKSTSTCQSIIQYPQNQLNKSMGIDLISNKTLTTNKNPVYHHKEDHNHSMNMMLLNITQRDYSIGHNWQSQLKSNKQQQQNKIKPNCMKISMMSHNSQTKSPMTNNYSLSFKRNESSSKISLSKRAFGYSLNKNNNK